MKELYELKDKLCDELKNYGKKDLSASTLGTVKDLTKTAYYLGELIEGEEHGYSHKGRYDERNSSYYNRNSYAGGRRDDSRREMRRNSYDDGYSYHGDMVEELREIMDDVQDERKRQEFQKFINKMENM